MAAVGKFQSRKLHRTDRFKDQSTIMEQPQPMIPAIVFNGCYTIISPKGGHRTFEIKTVLKGENGSNPKSFRNQHAGKRTVGLLTGPDNTRSYTRFGWVNDSGIRVFKDKRREEKEDKPTDWEIYAKMLWSMITEGNRSRYFDMGYTVESEKHCLRCNRRLTHPESLASGLGPECAGRV